MSFTDTIGKLDLAVNQMNTDEEDLSGVDYITELVKDLIVETDATQNLEVESDWLSTLSSLEIEMDGILDQPGHWDKNTWPNIRAKYVNDLIKLNPDNNMV